MRYIDTNIFGYAIENHAKYGSACKKILMDIQEEKIKASASLLVLTELLGVLKKINKELERVGKPQLDVRANIDAVLSLPIVWIELEVFLVKRAAEYAYNISGADSIHVATMELNNISEILSADGDFQKIPFLTRC